MRITTWNVNSIRARLNRVLNWLDAQQPDVICLQELKCLEEQFPFDGFDTLGYDLAIAGQKTYNGVAVGARTRLEDVAGGLPWAEDDAARGLAASVEGVRVVSLYVPNGQKPGSDKYRYKLDWLAQLRGWLEAHASPDEPLVLCGDFNVAPDDRDVHDPEAWREQILCSTPEREHFQALLDWGLSDAFRHLTDEPGHYTWWDFRTRAFGRNAGLRIDHHLVTAPLLERLEAVEIDLEERGGGGETPSDHAPVTLVLRD